MKTHFSFALFACLLCHAGFADSAASDQRPNQPRHEAPARANPAKQIPRRQTHTVHTSAVKPPGKRPPVRPLSHPGVAAPKLGNARHLSPNPAIVAGSADLSKRNTGTIDGKQVHRRP
jgi:hypothetical protein